MLSVLTWKICIYESALLSSLPSRPAYTALHVICLYFIYLRIKKIINSEGLPVCAGWGVSTWSMDHVTQKTYMQTIAEQAILFHSCVFS